MFEHIRYLEDSRDILVCLLSLNLLLYKAAWCGCPLPTTTLMPIPLWRRSGYQWHKVKSRVQRFPRILTCSLRFQRLLGWRGRGEKVIYNIILKTVQLILHPCKYQQIKKYISKIYVRFNVIFYHVKSIIKYLNYITQL